MANPKRYVSANTMFLAGSGTVVGATSLTLTSFTDIYGNILTMTDFGDTGYITLEPDTSNEEQATFTGITANANLTYTLTGIKTSLAKNPYTETSALIRQHDGGTKVVITDTAAFWNTFPNKGNDETVTGQWTFTNTPIVPGTVSDASTTVKGVSRVSVAPVNAAIPIAVGNNDPRVPTALISTSSGASDAGKVPKLNSLGLLDASFTAIPIVRTYTSSGTWTKPTNLKYVVVEVQAGGGGGGGANSDSSSGFYEAAGGGGGGGYSKKTIATATLGATETVTIGAGGSGAAASYGAVGGNGANSSFGSNSTATGGIGGYSSGTSGYNGQGGLGGVGSGGDVNLYGMIGGMGSGAISGIGGGAGGNSFLGVGGRNANNADGFGLYGTGFPGYLYGGGGGGGFSQFGASYAGYKAGGAGGSGIVIVTEYF